MLCDGEDSDGEQMWIANPACAHRCRPVNCPNWPVCRSGQLASGVLKNGTCVSCDMSFGHLWIEAVAPSSPPDERWTCPVCLCTDAEIEYRVRLERCEHRVCVACFRSMRWPETDLKEPSDDDLVQIWEEQVEERRSLLRPCPLCRA